METQFDRTSSTELFFKKSINLLVSFVFVFSQVIPPSYAFTPHAELYPTSDIQLEKEISDDGAIEDQVATSYNTSQEFLTDSPLSAASGEQVSEEAYGVEESEFEDAVAHLNADYAAAVIVEPLSADDLAALTKLDVEVGIAVIEGKVVLFTSGSAEEIRVNPVADELLKSADLVAHSHVEGSVALPSIADMSLADGTEYVVSSDGVYAYTSEGYDNVVAYDYAYLAEKIADLYDPLASTKETRDILNEFIVAIDAYNENQENSVLFASAGETIFPGNPSLGFFDSVTPPANIAVSQIADPDDLHPANSVIRVDYATTNGSFGGAIMDFSVVPVDISGMASVSFDMRTDNNTVSNCPVAAVTNCLKIEFRDVFGNTASIFRSGLTSTFSQVLIPTAEIQTAQPAIDLTLIDEIIFVVEHFRVVNQTTGFLEIRTAGIPFISSLAPDGSLTGGDITPLPTLLTGERPSPTAFASSDGSTASVNLASSTFGTINYNGTDPASFGGIFINYGAGLADFTTAFPANQIVFGIDSFDVSQVKFEITDADQNRDAVFLTGLDNPPGDRKHYDIDLLNDFFGVDMTRVQTIAIVIEGAGGATVNFDWGPFDVIEPISPSGLPVTSITKLPLTSTGQRPEFLSFAPLDGTIATASLQSQTIGDLTYDGFDSDSFGGVFVSYGGGTIDFNTAFPGGLVVGVEGSGLPNKEVVLELTDVLNVRSEVLLTSVETFGQRYLITADKFFGVDLTQISTISFVTKGPDPQTLRVEWGKF